MTAARDDDWLAAQLRETERGEAAGYLAWRPPRWAPWVGGLWAFTGLGGGMTFEGNLLLTWTLAHQGAFLGYLWWDHRRSPSPRGPAPREFRVYYVILGLLAVAMFSTVLPVMIHVGGWAGAAIAGAAFTVVGLLAERAHDRITRTVKERLA